MSTNTQVLSAVGVLIVVVIMVTVLAFRWMLRRAKQAAVAALILAVVVVAGGYLGTNCELSSCTCGFGGSIPDTVLRTGARIRIQGRA